MPGRFITFEGGEGAGKSTQIRELAAALREGGLSVVTTREPGGSIRAEVIRETILSGAAKPYGPFGEAILFAAARMDHLNATIRPALARGEWVLCDRFADSTRVYQGDAGELDSKTIAALERVTLAGTRPDLTIIIDTPVEIGSKRAARRRGNDQADRFEAESVATHERIRQGYLAIAQAEPERCVVIDGNQPASVVATAIQKVVQERLLPA